MKKFLSVLTVLIFAVTVFGNGVSLNSPGTRSISMGGAYISNVNDYSAPYWNPAGLVNVCGTQASFFITDIIPKATYEYAIPSLFSINAKAETQHLIAPNAAFLWKCRFFDKLHLGLSFIVPAGLGIKWSGEDMAPLAGGDPDLNWESSIQVYNISLSAAMRFGDKLNVGGAFHLVHGSMTMDKGLDDPTTTLPAGLQYSEESDGWGYGFGLGSQYLLNKKFTLGAALRTRMTVNFEGTAENPLLPIATSGLAPAESDFEREITWPLWIGGGVSFRPNEKLLLAAEAQYSQWKESEESLVAEFDNATWESALASNGGNTIHLNWESATQIRFGAEYLLNKKLALRGGFYIDPAPGPDETQTFLIPNTDFTAVTCGFGYKPTCNLAVDFGFEYLIGKDRTDIDPATTTAPNGSTIGTNAPGTHGLDIIVPSIAVTYKFCKCKESCKK